MEKTFSDGDVLLAEKLNLSKNNIEKIILKNKIINQSRLKL
jgi:dimeric dUTPase (all-alpha-NTP-PPase superfamily)